MTLDERITYAEGRLFVAINNDESSETIAFWKGYIAGLQAAKRSNA